MNFRSYKQHISLHNNFATTLHSFARAGGIFRRRKKTTEKGKIENRIVYFINKKTQEKKNRKQDGIFQKEKTQKKLKQGGIFKKQKHTEKGKTEKGWYI